jgi:hypothetical protein
MTVQDNARIAALGDKRHPLIAPTVTRASRLAGRCRWGSAKVSKVRAGQQLDTKRSRTALLNPATRSGAARRGRMNRPMPCPPPFTSRPPKWPVTPEVAG